MNLSGTAEEEEVAEELALAAAKVDGVLEEEEDIRTIDVDLLLIPMVTITLITRLSDKPER